MRIQIIVLLLLFTGGCAPGNDPNRNSPLTDTKLKDVNKAINPKEPLAQTKMNDVYQGFISYVKDVQQKYWKGELEQPDNNPPDPN